MAPQTHPGKDAEDWQGLQIISRGANRLCARDPRDPRHCLKFELPAAERTQVGMRQRLRRWLAGRFPYFGENRTELRAYRKLRARLGTATDGRIAACRDLIDSTHGTALRCDCVSLADGSPAPSLYHHLFVDTRYRADVLCASVTAFEAWLLRNDIPLFDLNAGNFVVVPRGDSVELVCIDAKSVASGKEILPFSRWSRRLMHRKIQRRAHRLRLRIADALSGGSALAGRPPSH